MKQKISIIGAGNLGLSLVTGLVKSGKYSSDQFTLSRRRVEKLISYQKKGYITTDNNIEASKDAELIILAVLPQKINAVLNEIKESITEN
mgnify:CR=1 FL=1